MQLIRGPHRPPWQSRLAFCAAVLSLRCRVGSTSSSQVQAAAEKAHSGGFSLKVKVRESRSETTRWFEIPAVEVMAAAAEMVGYGDRGFSSVERLPVPDGSQ